MPFRLSSTEITLRKSGLRIGYDYLQTKHTLLLDVDTLVLTAKPLEEGQNDALTVQARMTHRYTRSSINDDTIVIHSESSTPISARLETLSKMVALAGIVRGGEWREKGDIILARLPAPLVIRVEPETRHVIVTLGSIYTRRAEHLHIEAVQPTLANILLDKIQSALLFYAQPVEVEIRSEGDVTRMRVNPSREARELGATSEN